MYDSGSYPVNALDYGSPYRWNEGLPYGSPVSVTYSFMTAVPSYYGGTINGFVAFNEQMKSSARQAMACWSAAANVDFIEVSDAGNGGQIRFGASSFSASQQAYAYSPVGTGYDDSGDVWMNTYYQGNFSPTVGTYAYEAMIHEVGHALGLKHPGDYSNGGNSTGPFLSAADDNTNNTVMSYNNVGGNKTDLGPYDRLAIAYLYGPRTPQTIGNLTSYGSGNDLAQGDDGINMLLGDGGNDTVFGYGGNDGLLGGDGNDSLVGGDGNDSINGNQGADTVTGDAGNDTVRGGKDSDQVYGNAGADDVYGDMANDTVRGGAGNDTLHGGRDDDLLYGDDGNDLLWGDKGNDTLTGGAGADWFRYAADSGHDVITDFSTASDTVWVASQINGTSITSTSAALARVSNTSNGCIIDLGNGNDVTLLGISKSQLSTWCFYVT